MVPRRKANKLRYFSDLSQTEIQLVVSSLRSADYYLLAGAGVSLDSHGGLGPLPSGGGLQNELTKKTGVAENTPLHLVYKLLDDTQIRSEITERFTCTECGPTILALADIAWRNIFTLNVDDCLETAWVTENTELSRKQSLTSVNFTDDYYETDDKSEALLVHLHGFVRRPEDGYVFSHTEYARVQNSLNVWMNLLSHIIRTEPFIVAGTQLDEIDLEYYMSFRDSAMSRPDTPPSILIEPYPTKLTELKCDETDMVLFPGTTLEFFTELNTLGHISSDLSNLLPTDGTDLFGDGVSDKAMAKFFSGYELVPTKASGDDNSARFLLGTNPNWKTLDRNVDISRPFSTELFEILKSDISKTGEKSDNLIVVLGDAGAGTSTIARKTAYQLRRSGALVLFSDPVLKTSVSLFSDMIDLIDEDVYVFIDNVADRMSEVVNMLDGIEKTNILFVCFERDYRRTYIESNTAHLEYSIVSGIGFEKPEAKALIELYDKFGLSGTGRKTKGSIDSLATNISGEPIAIAACRIMHDFSPIERIAKSLIDESSDFATRAYIIAALARYCYAGGVRYHVLQSIVKSGTLRDQLRGKFPLSLSHPGRNKSFIVPSNAVLSERILDVVKKTNIDELFRLYVKLANNSGKMVNRTAIRKRSPESQMTGRLLDYDKVVKRFLGEDRALEFYEEIKDVWDWNSRYWEQVALLKLERARTHFRDKDETKFYLDQAERHARFALRIEDHPLSLTTLAKILFSSMEYNPREISNKFDEAWKSAITAIEREKKWNRVTPTSFTVALTGAQSFMKLGGTLSTNRTDDLIMLKDEVKRRRMYHGELRSLIEETFKLGS